MPKVSSSHLIVANDLVIANGLIIDNGLMSCATVTGIGDAVYFVVTGQHIPNALRDWKNRMKAVTCLNLRKLPEVAQVVWMRHFTRLS